MSHHCFSTSPRVVREAVETLNLACRERGIGLNVLPGADVRLTPELVEQLESGHVLTIADAGAYLLLEMPPQVVPPIGDLVFQLALQGVRPVITHPELHGGFARRPQLLVELVQKGCLAQVTGGSLVGKFGRDARRTAERFILDGLVHVVASDAHSPEGHRRPDFEPLVRRLTSLVGADGALRLLCVNPARIVSGLSVSPCPGSEGSPVRVRTPGG
jgi:protein-tyrosine phosphatase